MAGPRFDVITLFPDQFPALLELGVVGRALKKGLFDLHCWNPRDFTEDAHRTIDDRPYGGGPGMVMLAKPLVKTVAAIRASRGESAPTGFTNPGADIEKCPTALPAESPDSAILESQTIPDRAPLVFMTPHGPLLNQQAVRGMQSDWSSGCILLCGRYEGVDQRFIDTYVDHTFCLGDFVLSGGDLPVACLLDAWVRLLPGALNHSESAEQDSFESGLLDCPHYTRPEVFENKSVPEVLLSGNHARIAGWRFDMSKDVTRRFRPDLLDQYESTNQVENAATGKIAGNNKGKCKG